MSSDRLFRSSDDYYQWITGTSISRLWPNFGVFMEIRASRCFAWKIDLGSWKGKFMGFKIQWSKRCWRHHSVFCLLASRSCQTGVVDLRSKMICWELMGDICGFVWYFLGTPKKSLSHSTDIRVILWYRRIFYAHQMLKDRGISGIKHPWQIFFLASPFGNRLMHPTSTYSNTT